MASNERHTDEEDEDWREFVLASQHAFAEARERGNLPNTVELIREAREERDRQLPEALA